MSLGLLFTPCAGPIIAAVSLVAATQQFSIESVIVTLVYALGAGVVLLPIAIATQRGLSLPRLRVHTPYIRQGLGALMVAAAVVLALDLDTRLAANVPGYTRSLQGLEESAVAATEIRELTDSKEQIIGRSESEEAQSRVGASDVEGAIAGISSTASDVVLPDVHMPDGGGAAVIQASSAGSTTVRFLALFVSDAVEDVIAVICAGARGYVTKSISADEPVVAIQRVAEGDAVFSPCLAGLVPDAFAGGAEQGIDPELDQLTPREREALRLIARGSAYKEVALELSISIKTVETHVAAVLRKLQLSNRHQLTRWATDRRLV